MIDIKILIKTRTTKVKTIKNGEIIIAIKMMKIIITTVIMAIITIMMNIIKVKIGNHIKIKNC